GVTVYGDDWNFPAGGNYRWREHEGRGYWNKGVWIGFYTSTPSAVTFGPGLSGPDFLWLEPAVQVHGQTGAATVAAPGRGAGLADHRHAPSSDAKTRASVARRAK